ncbi:hypothetical protein [Teredinibacter purpureus]|uniref:hypothetical protein n=1 Tax=Teredinibacter purpureus TaxID=2731756 RepID=UPI0005F78B61|nr:hypothetical protein [Teredinibacter purpureus]
MIPPPKENDKSPTLPPIPDSNALTVAQLVDISKVQKLVNNWGTTIEVAPIITYEACNQNRNDGFSSGGYRYRLPADGTVSIKRNVKTGSQSAQLKEVARTTLPIAQYGPLAELPSDFSGGDGNISFSVFTDTGTMQSLTIGVTPKLSENISAAGDIVKTYRTAEEAEKEKADLLATDTAAAAEAAASAELEVLRKEKELLELQRDIQNLKNELSGATQSD